MNSKGKKKEQSSKNIAYAATKAEEILKRIGRQSSSLQQNVVVYSSINDCWSLTGKQ